MTALRIFTLLIVSGACSAAPLFPDLGRGSISNVALTDQTFTDEVVTANVNTTPPPGGSLSVQGVMARCRQSASPACPVLGMNSFYWLAIDFADGTLVMEKLLDTGLFSILFDGPIPGLDPNESYKLQFTLLGASLQGSVLDIGGTMIAATPLIIDSSPLLIGESGLLTEISPGALPAPLQASFSNYCVTATSGAVCESFPGSTTIISRGTYNGDNAWTFSSTVAGALDNSPTAYFNVQNGQLITGDTESAFVPEPGTCVLFLLGFMVFGAFRRLPDFHRRPGYAVANSLARASAISCGLNPRGPGPLRYATRPPQSTTYNRSGQAE
jgi:hypothetical protein